MSFRRTWDKELYAQKAQERLDGKAESEEKKAANRAALLKEEFRAADKDAAGPMGSERAFLKAREGKIDLESKVGKVEVINQVEDATRAGFWCEVCSCLLKDSAAYLSHINGKKHQRALGFSMRVERADVSDVKQRLEELKRKANAAPVVRPSAIEEHDQKIKAQEEQKEALKRRLKEEAEARKRQKIFAEEQEDDDVLVEGDDVAALMGFGGFGGSKKK